MQGLKISFFAVIFFTGIISCGRVKKPEEATSMFSEKIHMYQKDFDDLIWWVNEFSSDSSTYSVLLPRDFVVTVMCKDGTDLFNSNVSLDNIEKKKTIGLKMDKIGIEIILIKRREYIQFNFPYSNCDFGFYTVLYSQNQDVPQVLKDKYMFIASHEIRNGETSCKGWYTEIAPHWYLVSMR